MIFPYYSHIPRLYRTRLVNRWCAFLTPPDKLSAAPQWWHQTPLYSISKTQRFQNTLSPRQMWYFPTLLQFSEISSVFLTMFFFLCSWSHLPPNRHCFALLACSERPKLSLVISWVVVKSFNCWKLVKMVC